MAIPSVTVTPSSTVLSGMVVEMAGTEPASLSVGPFKSSPRAASTGSPVSGTLRATGTRKGPGRKLALVSSRKK